MNKRFEKLKKIVNIKEYNFLQLNSIIENMEGLTDEEIKLLANPALEPIKINYIADLIKKGLPKNIINQIINKNLNYNQLVSINIALTENIAYKDIELAVKYSNKINMNEIFYLIKKGIEPSFIEKNINLIKKSLNNYTLNDFVSKAFKEQKIKPEILEYSEYSDIKHKNILYKNIYELIRKGFNKEAIKKIVKNFHSINDYGKIYGHNMNILFKISKYPELFELVDKFNFFKDWEFFDIGEILESMYNNYVNEKLSVKDIETYIYTLYHNNDIKYSKWILNDIKLLFKSGIKREKIYSFLESLKNLGNTEVSLYITDFLEKELKDKIFQYIDEKTYKNISSLYEDRLNIIKGIINNFSKEQINTYIKLSKKFPAYKEEIISGFENGLTKELIEFYLNFPVREENIINFYFKKFIDFYQKQKMDKKEINEKIIEIMNTFTDENNSYIFAGIIDLFLDFFYVLIQKEEKIDNIKKTIKKLVEINLDQEDAEMILNFLKEEKISLKEINLILETNLYKSDFKNIIYILTAFSTIMSFYFDIKKNREIKEYIFNIYIEYCNSKINKDSFDIKEIKEELLKTENIIKEILKKGTDIKILYILLNPKINYAYKKLIIKSIDKFNLNFNQIKLMLLTEFKIMPEIIKDIEFDESRHIITCRKKPDKNIIDILKRKTGINKIIDKSLKNIDIDKDNKI